MRVYFADDEKKDKEEEDLKDIPQEALDMLSNNK